MHFMNLRALRAACGLAFLPAIAAAQPPTTFPLRYQWTPGQTLCYLVQRDPYFTDPAQAIETTNTSAPYRPPIVQRLTEQVLAVGRDGTATLRLTLAAEPGFEEEASPQPPTVQTVSVTPLGQVISQENALADPELLAAIFRLPAAPAPTREGLAILTQDGFPRVTQNTSPGHDGLLLQTTRSRRHDRIVFAAGTGTLLRRTATITASLSLVMIRPAGRSAADFGHVVPNLPIFQTLTVERENAPFPAAALPLRASTARQSKS